MDESLKKWARQAGILALYAHGSRVRQGARARPDSDLDLAVLFGPRLEWRAELAVADELASRLQPQTRYPLDVRVLNDAPPAFQFRVLRDRALLWEEDRRARVRFEARIFREYQDQQYYRDQYDAALRRQIQEGKFGRRPAIRRPPA